MPAAVAVPAIASVVGAGAGLFGQHKAGQQAERARREEMAYAREQQAVKQKRYDAALQSYRQNYQTWLGMYGNKGLKRYGMPSGITVNRPGAPAPGGPAPGGPVPGGPAPAGMAPAGETQTLGGMLSAPPPAGGTSLAMPRRARRML